MNQSKGKKSNFTICQSIQDLSNSNGGPTKTVSQLSAKLINYGIDVNLITQKGFVEFPNFKFKEHKYEKYTKTKFSFNPLLIKKMFSYAREKFYKNAPQIIHDNGIWLPFNNTISQISREFKIPLIISPHGMLEPWSLNHKFYKKKLAEMDPELKCWAHTWWR